jgi:hypothetical protein
VLLDKLSPAGRRSACVAINELLSETAPAATAQALVFLAVCIVSSEEDRLALVEMMVSQSKALFDEPVRLSLN